MILFLNYKNKIILLWSLLWDVNVTRNNNITETVYISSAYE